MIKRPTTFERLILIGEECHCCIERIVLGAYFEVMVANDLWQSGSSKGSLIEEFDYPKVMGQ